MLSSSRKVDFTSSVPDFVVSVLSLPGSWMCFISPFFSCETGILFKENDRNTGTETRLCLDRVSALFARSLELVWWVGEDAFLSISKREDNFHPDPEKSYWLVQGQTIMYSEQTLSESASAIKQSDEVWCSRTLRPWMRLLSPHDYPSKLLPWIPISGLPFCSPAQMSVPLHPAFFASL